MTSIFHEGDKSDEENDLGAFSTLGRSALSGRKSKRAHVTITVPLARDQVSFSFLGYVGCYIVI